MFDFEIKSKSGTSLIIFSGQVEGDDAYYGEKFDFILKRRNSPYKSLIFLFPKYIETKINEFLFCDSKFESNLCRAHDAEQIFLMAFDGYANLHLHYCISELKKSKCEFDNEFKDELIKAGLNSLVESRKDKIILKAPPGTVFQKPSKKRFSEFIKSSELAVGFSENQFVAFSLLSCRPKRGDPHQIKNIWIDTSSISQYIESLIDYISRFNGDEFRLLQYRSFQSYGDDKTEGYKACIPDVKDDVWIIISASRSNDMGVDIFSTWDGVRHDQIITLLSYTDSVQDQNCLSYSNEHISSYPARPGDNIVINISNFSDSHKMEKIYGSEVPIKIIGENFTAQVEKPNTVLLRKPHGPSEISKFIDPIKTCKFLLANKKHKRLRPIFFDFVKFHNENSELKKKYLVWLKNIVEWYVPSSVGAIIYDFNDESSRLLYRDLIPLIKSENISEIHINGNISFNKQDAILALLPVMTRGNTFIKLNSDLRLMGHSAQRIFIAPFSLSHSKGEYDAFARSLILAPKELKYQFFNYKRIFIGHQEVKNSWERELDVVGQFSNPLWEKRARLLQKQSQGIENEVGISCDLSNDKLGFNVDFAFWKDDYDSNDVNPVAVYLTVSAILQNLREKPFTFLDKESLSAHIYQHSIIDPKNFSRFNDPLLQSCLWRCAYDGELDYNSADDLSRQFCSIVERLAKCRADGDRNATLDLLVGIAVRKVKLSKDCLNEMIEALRVILSGFSEFDEILNFIENGFKNREFEFQEC